MHFYQFMVDSSKKMSLEKYFELPFHHSSDHLYYQKVQLYRYLWMWHQNLTLPVQILNHL